MKPVDYRNETFATLKARLAGQRQQVLEAWRVHGPCTTEQLAERSGLSILTLRPRTTELFQIGMVVLENSEDGKTGSPAFAPSRLPCSTRSGVYRAASEFEARAAFDAAKREAMQEQILLKV